MHRRSVTIADLAVDAVAAYRLTRLVTADEVSAGIRDFVIEQAYHLHGKAGSISEAMPYSTWTERALDDPSAPKLARLVVCRWCAGWWVAVAIVAMRRRHPRLWEPIADVAACSAAAALLAGLEK